MSKPKPKYLEPKSLTEIGKQISRAVLAEDIAEDGLCLQDIYAFEEGFAAGTQYAINAKDRREEALRQFVARTVRLARKEKVKL